MESREDEMRRLVDKAENEFTPKLNQAMESLRNPDSTMPTYRMIAIHGILLSAAGYMEALINAGQEAIWKAQRERGMITPQMQRIEFDLIYAAYTAGYNGGILEADKHRDEMKTLAIKTIVRESGH